MIVSSMPHPIEKAVLDDFLDRSAHRSRIYTEQFCDRFSGRITPAGLAIVVVDDGHRNALIRAV
jgi:hypothetical protein